MKQLNLLPVKALMILCTFFMVACGDDESAEINESPLVGKWQWTINRLSNCDDDAGDIPLTDCTSGCWFYEFGANGSFKITFQEGETTETGTGTYILENGVLSVCIVDGSTEECFSGDVTISGDTFDWFFPKEDETVCDQNRIMERI